VISEGISFACFLSLFNLNPGNLTHSFFLLLFLLHPVIAGIILGPTVMGRIPGFQQAIFPSGSLPYLNLIATLGLVFFLFQVGLEVDLQVIRKDWHKSVSIAVAGMALPFGLGAAASVGLYKLQNDPSIPFGSFLLFLGVAMSITVNILPPPYLVYLLSR
jgi:Kef-type K+ transport system membrane component KefB